LALSVVQSGGAEGSSAGIDAGAAQLNITDGTNQTLYVGFVIDDQATSTFTTTVTFGGVSPTGTIATSTATSIGTYMEAWYWVNPPSGSLQDLLVSASPAFDDRQWSAVFVVMNDNDQSTPFDAATVSESAAATTNGATVSSATGDVVLSFCSVDNKTTPNAGVGASATGGTAVINEQGSTGAIYLGASQCAGAASITSDWDWTSTRVTSCFTFNVNAASAGAATPPLVVPAKLVRGARANRKRRAA
jgi:hypothetical protein